MGILLVIIGKSLLYYGLIYISGAQEYCADLAVITLAIALKGDILAYDQVIQGVSGLGTIPLLDFWGIDARQSDLMLWQVVSVSPSCT